MLTSDRRMESHNALACSWVRMASTFSMVKLPLRSVKPYQKIMSSGMMMKPTAQTR